jgi:hypothetical protein
MRVDDGASDGPPGDGIETVVEGSPAVPVAAGGGDRIVATLLGAGDVDLSTDAIMAHTRGE